MTKDIDQAAEDRLQIPREGRNVTRGKIRGGAFSLRGAGEKDSGYPATDQAAEPTAPPADRARLVRAAADLLGRDGLATAVNVKPRAVHYWINGERSVSDDVLRDLRDALIRHRQLVGALVDIIRPELNR